MYRPQRIWARLGQIGVWVNQRTQSPLAPPSSETVLGKGFDGPEHGIQIVGQTIATFKGVGRLGGGLPRRPEQQEDHWDQHGCCR